MEFKALGKHSAGPSRELETFPAPAYVDFVSLASDEVTSMCPVTGQPDWETVTIEYVPDRLCIESKSLKLFFWSLRDEGVFCEALAAQIATAVFDAARPRRCTVRVVQKPRGGITITAVASRSREAEPALTAPAAE
jgi:7-cyano-7-deazaguanine reductase